MFCQGCGKEISDDTKFCPSCGRPVGSVDAQQARTTGSSEAKGSNSFNNKILLIIGIAVIAVLLVVIMVIFKGKKEESVSDTPSETSAENTETDLPSEEQATSYDDIIGSWKRSNNVTGDNYASWAYEPIQLLEISSQGILGNAVTETVYSVSAKDVENKTEGGITYHYFTGEMRTKPNADNGAERLKTEIRLYINEDGKLCYEIYTPQDKDWVLIARYRHPDSDS